MVIESYQELRIGENGKPYIAVVALSVASTPEGCPARKRKNPQAGRKLEQLREEVGKAEDAVVGYNANTVYTERKSNGCIETTFVVAASAAYWGDKSPTTNGVCTESISDQYMDTPTARR